MNARSDLNFEPALAALPPRQAAFWGFRSGARGTHSCRTMMLAELSLLLAAVPGAASRREYAQAVIGENCLGKRTASNRKLSFQRLSELYGLDAQLPLFRVLRGLWRPPEAGRPLLALLLALARDPLLRASARAVAAAPPHSEVTRQALHEALAEAAAGRLNEATLAAAARNAASSWTQSGHLRGKYRKIRRRVEPTPDAAAYALLLGFAAGRRGKLLFETPWCAVLDAEPGELVELAAAARRLGLLHLKQSGAMIEVSFPALSADCREAERSLLHGAHRKTG